MLEVRRLSMDFSGFSALSDVSLSIEAGSTTAIVGPNGAGKTTLLNCVCGMYRPRSGDVLLRGESILRLRPSDIARRGVARTFQNVEHARSLTAAELTMLGCHESETATFIELALRLPRARRDEHAHRALALEIMRELRIVDVADHKLETLPYAMRKSADLARALAARPKLLLLDEPSAGMASVEKDLLRRSLRQLRGTWYETLVIVDHDIAFLQAICDSTVVLDFGKKIAEGSTAAVLSDPHVVEAYLGVPLESG